MYLVSKEEAHWIHVRMTELRKTQRKSLEEARRILDKESELHPWDKQWKASPTA